MSMSPASEQAVSQGAPSTGARAILVLSLAWLNTYFLLSRVLEPFVAQRLVFADQVLSGQMEPPYQYRVLKHLLARAIGLGASLLTSSPEALHLIEYGLVIFLTFVGLFWSAWRHFERQLPPAQALIALLLLQTSLPLAITGFMMEGDFITLLIYLLVLEVAQTEKPWLLVPIITLGALNREQVIYALVFYAGVVWTREGRLTQRQLLALLGATVGWAVVFQGLRLHFGLKPTRYTPALHIARNTAWVHVWRDILPLWGAELGGLLALLTLGWKRASLTQKRCCLALLPYTLLFFLNGNLWELGKFLPAWLFVLPIALLGLFPPPTPPRAVLESA